jgi:hypothetical protein
LSFSDYSPSNRAGGFIKYGANMVFEIIYNYLQSELGIKDFEIYVKNYSGAANYIDY